MWILWVSHLRAPLQILSWTGLYDFMDDARMPTDQSIQFVPQKKVLTDETTHLPFLSLNGYTRSTWWWWWYKNSIYFDEFNFYTQHRGTHAELPVFVHHKKFFFLFIMPALTVNKRKFIVIHQLQHGDLNTKMEIFLFFSSNTRSVGAILI